MDLIEEIGNFFNVHDRILIIIILIFTIIFEIYCCIKNKQSHYEKFLFIGCYIITFVITIIGSIGASSMICFYFPCLLSIFLYIKDNMLNKFLSYKINYVWIIIVSVVISYLLSFLQKNINTYILVVLIFVISIFSSIYTVRTMLNNDIERTNDTNHYKTRRSKKINMNTIKFIKMIEELTLLSKNQAIPFNQSICKEQENHIIYDESTKESYNKGFQYKIVFEFTIRNGEQYVNKYYDQYLNDKYTVRYVIDKEEKYINIEINEDNIIIKDGKWYFK